MATAGFKIFSICVANCPTNYYNLKFRTGQTMDFGDSLVKYGFLFCLLGGPVIIFLVKPSDPHWKKYGKFLLPVFLFFLFLNYTSPLYECFQSLNNGCWKFKLFSFTLAMLEYTIYLGWFEYVWRRWHDQISWPLKENLKYGAVSNIFLIVSAFMTLVILFVFFINNIPSLFFNRN
jgi:hypothetical protein